MRDAPMIGIGIGPVTQAVLGGGLAPPKQANLIRQWLPTSSYITEATDIVSSWVDARQSVPSTDAVTNGPDWIPGDPSVDFVVGSAEALEEASADADAQITDTGITAWAVVTVSGATNQNLLSKWDGGATPIREWALQAHNTTPVAPRVFLRNSADSASQTIDGGSSILGVAKSLLIFKVSGATGSAEGKLWVNSDAPVTASTLSWRTDSAVLALGALSDLATSTLNGKIWEAGLYNVGFTDADAAALKTYVNAKHGTAWT